LAWTIQAARHSKLLDGFAVSTEDEEIKEVARRYGAAALDRPPELAADDTTTKAVLKQVNQEIGGPDAAIVLLQATSPIRREGLIDRTIEAFRSGDYDSMSTGGWQMQYPPHGVEHRRQDVKQVFVNDGSVIVLKAANLAADVLFGAKAGTLATSREENVDIDEPFDFWLAEKILEKGLSEGWLVEPSLSPRK
jgi:N-acylneuraminate cytidylyltransferase